MSYVYHMLYLIDRQLYALCRPFNRACVRFLESQDYDDTED